jgi:hypothetical protein
MVDWYNRGKQYLVEYFLERYKLDRDTSESIVKYLQDSGLLDYDSVKEFAQDIRGDEDIE